MSMKIVFIKDYVGVSINNEPGLQKYKPLDEVFAIRKIAQQLISNDMAIPAVRKESNPIYQRLLKEKMKQEIAEKKNDANKENNTKEQEELPKKKRGRKKAISKNAELRETTISQ